MEEVTPYLGWVILVVLFIVGLCAVIGSGFVIHTKQAGIVERMGKFNRIAEPGFNLKLPFIESCVHIEDLNMQLTDVPVSSKTKDDATITIPVRVQFYVIPEKVKEAYYELDEPEDQIRAHVENVLLSYIPKITLDQTYEQEDDIAKKVKESLAGVMSKFGYAIENALVTKIEPAGEVINAMNNINASRRNKVAIEAKAEADKIQMIAKAEGEKQAKILAGEGIAGERKAIVEGLKESIGDLGSVKIGPDEAMTLIMLAQYFDALRDIGKNSNTILMPHSPSAVLDLKSQLRDAIITGHLAANEASKS